MAWPHGHETDTDDIANASDVPGEKASDAIDNVEAEASAAQGTANAASTAAAAAQSTANAASTAAAAAQSTANAASTAAAAAQSTANAAVPQTRTVSAGTGLTGGGDLTNNRTLAADFGTASGKVCEGNDSRLSDSRAPNGSAGGDLASSYPNPQVAAIHETGGPTKLTIGAIADGRYARRSGSDLVGDYLFASPGIWFADCKPVSPSAYDDFWTVDGSGAPSGWTEFDQNGTVVPSVADGFLQLALTSNATKQIAGIYKAIPTEAEWFMWTKVALQGAASVANQVEGGIFVAQDLVGSPTTADFSTNAITVSGTANALSTQKQTWTAYNAGSTVAGSVTIGHNHAYIGIGYDGTNLTHWWSTDGTSWLRTVTAAKPFTPVYLGLYGLSTNGSAGVVRFNPFLVALGTGVSSSLTRDITRGRRIY